MYFYLLLHANTHQSRNHDVQNSGCPALNANRSKEIVGNMGATHAQNHFVIFNRLFCRPRSTSEIARSHMIIVNSCPTFNIMSGEILQLHLDVSEIVERKGHILSQLRLHCLKRSPRRSIADWVHIIQKKSRPSCF